MEFLLFILFGLIVGAIAKFLMPGRDPGGFVVTALIGMIGSLLGGLIGRALGLYAPGRYTAGFILSIIGAVILLALYRVVVRRRVVA